MMKNIFFVSFVLVFLEAFPNALAREIPEEMRELVEMLHTMCQAESGVPEALISDAQNGKFADDQQLKCYIKCTMAELALLDEDDGTIDEEATIALMPESIRAIATKAIRTCGTQRGADLCETAFLTSKCYYEQAPDDYVLP